MEATDSRGGKQLIFFATKPARSMTSSTSSPPRAEARNESSLKFKVKSGGENEIFVKPHNAL